MIYRDIYQTQNEPPASANLQKDNY